MKYNVGDKVVVRFRGPDVPTTLCHDGDILTITQAPTESISGRAGRAWFFPTGYVWGFEDCFLEPLDVCPEDMGSIQVSKEAGCECASLLAGHEEGCAYARGTSTERARLERVWAIPQPKPAEEAFTYTDRKGIWK